MTQEIMHDCLTIVGDHIEKARNASEHQYLNHRAEAWAREEADQLIIDKYGAEILQEYKTILDDYDENA